MKMTHVWIVLLMFGIGQMSDHCNALQHNLFYGDCTFDNNTITIYTQVVKMDNLQLARAKKSRGWFGFIANPFRRRTPPPSSFGQGNAINTTVAYPPHVSIIFLQLLELYSFRPVVLC